MKMHSLLSVISMMLLMFAAIPALAQDTGNPQKGKDLFVGKVRF